MWYEYEIYLGECTQWNLCTSIDHNGGKKSIERE